MGGSMKNAHKTIQNQGFWRGIALICDSNSYKINNITQITLNPTPKINYLQHSKAYADTDCTETFLTQNSLYTDKIVSKNPLRITQPNGKLLHTTHTRKLLNKALPPETRQAHIVPNLKYSLVVIVPFCDNGCDVLYQIENPKS